MSRIENHPGVVLAIVAGILWFGQVLREQLIVWRIYQIEEYDGDRVLRWNNARAWSWHRSVKFSTFVVILGLLAYIAVPTIPNTLPGSWALGAVGAVLLWRWAPPKKALVWTPRMRRLATVTLLLDVVAFAIAAVVASIVEAPVVAAGLAIACLFAPLFMVLVTLVASLLMSPYEAWVRRRFLAMAGGRLAEVHPVVVAIAGSWGKTSTKHALAAILPAEAAAHPTRKSFNTLMGITRVINEDLTDDHRTFIVEMDPYARGEVAAMSRLVHQQHAIITAVGAQHAERFVRGVADITDAIYECVEALPEDGTAVIYVGADGGGRELLDRARADGHRVIGYGIEGDAGSDGDGDGELDVSASNVVVGAEGIDFTFNWPSEHLEFAVHAPLLGRHHALNLTASLVMVHLLGHDVPAAVAAAATLEPVEHRLQRLPTSNGIIVIDDSYNANPVGVHNGLDVLAELAPRTEGNGHGGQRILVTPGLVELGTQEVDENRRYGEHAGRVCDHVIITRNRSRNALLEGLEEGGIEPEGVHLVDSLDGATAVIGEVARAGDVVLFANDLPDTYL